MSASAPPAIADLFSLEGRTAIVTGGTGGLGLAMTVALAEGGANIVSIEIPNDPGASALKEKVEGLKKKYTSFTCDVKDSKSLRATFQKIWDSGVTPDILLNCAGIQRRGQAEELDDDIIDDVLDINLKATFIAGQEVAKKLISLNRPGKIINVASIISFVAMSNISPYAASKGGVLQTTKAFSSEWASKGIQVNCICPGYYRTALTEQYQTDPKYKHFNDYLMSRVPAGRWGEPTDLRGTVIFLASKASDYVSGTSIVVDGGMIGR